MGTVSYRLTERTAKHRKSPVSLKRPVVMMNYYLPLQSLPILMANALRAGGILAYCPENRNVQSELDFVGELRTFAGTSGLWLLFAGEMLPQRGQIRQQGQNYAINLLFSKSNRGRRK